MTKIILFGDSITAGYENGLTDFRVNEGIEEKFPDVEVINAGIPGDNTNGAVARVQDHVVKYQPNIVVIFFGANDAAIHSGVSVSDYQQNLELLIKMIGSKKVILIGGPFALQEDKYGLDRPLKNIEAFSQVAEVVAKENQVPFVNILEEMLSRNPEELLQDDGLHFSDQGYALLIKLINQEIAKKRDKNG